MQTYYLLPFKGTEQSVSCLGWKAIRSNFAVTPSWFGIEIKRHPCLVIWLLLLLNMSTDFFIRDFIEHASEEVHWVKYGRRHEDLPCPLLLGTLMPRKLYGLSYLGSISLSPLHCFLSFQVLKNWHMLIICNNGLHCDILVCGYVIWSYSHMPLVPRSHWCIAECLAAFLTSSHHMLWHSPIHTNQMSPDVR